MLKVEYSPKALEDLLKIKSYITINRGENVASQVLKNITSMIETLKTFPHAGKNLGNMLQVTTDYHYVYIDSI